MSTTNLARCMPTYRHFPGHPLSIPNMRTNNHELYYRFAMQPPTLPTLHETGPMTLYYDVMPPPIPPTRSMNSDSPADTDEMLPSSHCSLDQPVSSPAELSTDEQQSLNSSGDQGPAAFNRGVAGASSPLQPHKNHRLSLSPTLSISSATFHPQTIDPRLSRPLNYAPQFQEPALSSSMRALLENRNTLDATQPPPPPIKRTGSQLDHIDPINSHSPKSLTEEVNAQAEQVRSNLNSEPNPTDHLLLPTLLPTHAKQKPLIFNMDYVRYVRSVAIADQIVSDLVLNQQPQMVSISCESDCGLTNQIDLLSLAVAQQQSPGTITIAHPRVYVFDVYAQTQLIRVLRPLLASQHIIKVMFDARLVLRLLRRVYNVQTVVALFDAQLAFRLLSSQLQGCPFARQKRDDLMRVAWQCNAPSVNFHRPTARQDNWHSTTAQPSFHTADGSINSHSSTAVYWTNRPVTAQLLYHAAYEAFVLIPQLASNLMAMMDLVLNDNQKQLFRDLSDQLICRHLVNRPFRRFAHRNQYLHELQTQVSLLTASASVDRLGQLPASTANCALHSPQKAMQSPLKRYGIRLCGHKDGVGCDENCLPADQYNQKLQAIEQNRWSFNQSNQSNMRKKNALNEKWPDNSMPTCECDPKTTHQVKSEMKCMNLLVDQIIDLIEMKDDCLTQGESL